MYNLTTFIIHAKEGYLDPPNAEGLVIEQVKPDYRGKVGIGYNDVDVNGPFDVDGYHVSLQGDLNQLCATMTKLIVGVSRIKGADDDTYDYFPSCFDGVRHLAMQLDELIGSHSYIEALQYAWDELTRDHWIYRDRGYLANQTLLDYRAEFADEILPRP